MEKMHNLLRRQLKKSFGEDLAAPAEWGSFLEAVNSAYCEFDADRAMLERSMDLNSRELMQLNADLRESERRYRMLFERAPLGLVHFDQQGVIIDCNDHILQIIGSTREKLIGLDMPRQLTNRGVLQALESCFAEGKGTYEGDYESVTGRRRTIMRLLFSRLTSDNGAVIGGIGIIEDIAERRHGEQLLRLSEQKFRGLFESSRDGIMFTDLQGRIQDVNHAILAMTGYSREELLAMTFQQLTPPKWHAMEEEIMRTRVLATGSSGEYEKEYVRKDGTVIPVALSVWFQRDESGKPVGMWGTVRDSSERRRTEDEVRRKMAEIEKLNRFMIGREERIIEVKREVNELLTRHGQPPKYKV